MHVTSSAYKAEQKRDFRNRSYVWVYLGLVNSRAQETAYVSSELADFSSTDIFSGSQFEAYYATAEDGLCMVDGSLPVVFMPEEARLYPAAKQGAVSRQAMGAVTFSFPVAIDSIGGLTIDFGDCYPTQFTVTNGTETYTHDNSSPGQTTLMDVFGSTSHITVTPLAMSGGSQRLRIHSVAFGAGFVFGNAELLSTRRSNRVHHLSEELPSKSFEFTISNLDQMWTLDNPKSYAKALEEMQVVQVTYGRELDDGSIYKIPSGRMALKTWSSTDTQAAFSAVGFLDYSTTTYFRGKCHPEGITLYELAEEVLADMGVTDYRLDAYLRHVTTKNPLPVDLHKNCLQMIANAAECTLFENAEGVIELRTSFYAPNNEISAENCEAYSNVSAVAGEGASYVFAAAEAGLSAVDGSEAISFMGEGGGIQPTGIVSYLYPTDRELSVTLSFEATWTFVGLTLEFNIIHPAGVTVTEYSGDRKTGESSYAIDGLSYYISHEFNSMDRIVFTFSGVADNTRIHLNRISIGGVTDYSITERDLQSYPAAAQTDRIRNVNIKYFQFFEGTAKRTTIVDADKGENLVTFSVPCFGYGLSYRDSGTSGSLSILESGAYYVIFTSSVAANVEISATEYVRAENAFIRAIRETGSDLTLENDLISDAERAERVADWYAEYYGAEVEYAFDYRGEPALDCNDRIYLENRFVDNNMVLVTEEELSTSTGMGFSNRVTARRLSYTAQGEDS